MNTQASITDPVTTNKTCSVFWDDRLAAVFTCGTLSGGGFAATNIPVQGPPGRHAISVICQPWCNDTKRPDPWRAEVDFTTLSTVPELTGLTYGDSRIQQRLLAADLQLGSQAGPTDFQATVIQQHPAAGTAVWPGDPVDIVFALPKTFVQLVKVPDVLKHDKAGATRLIRLHQLTLGTVTGSGWVIHQTPAAGTPVAPGTAVDLRLAAPPPRLVTVPDIRGVDVAQARKRIQHAGLELDTGGATTGVVVSQLPKAGQRVPRGTTVTASIRKPAVILAASHGSTPWNAIGIALLALIVLAGILICTTGFPVKGDRRRSAKRKPWTPDGIAVTCRLGEFHLKTRPTGPAPDPVLVDLHGPVANIKIKEVTR